MAKSKMYEGIKQALALIEAGEYQVINGNLYRNGKKLGSLDKRSGNVYYVIKGVDIVASRLFYAYFNGGVDSLLDGHGIHYLDDNRLNNTASNLVQLPRKGYRKALEELCKGLATELNCPLPNTTADNTPQGTYTAKELEARAIMQELNAGLPIVEVAKKLGVKTSRCYDVKRGKVNYKATADLR
jgi:hypothetical protein